VTTTWSCSGEVWLTATPTFGRADPHATAVGSVAPLLDVFVSPGVATEAVLVTWGTAANATATVSVMALFAPGPSAVALVQMTVWPAAPQFQPVPVPDTWREMLPQWPESE